MRQSDWWSLVMALVVVLAPLFLAWGILARGERKRDVASRAQRHHRR